MAESTGVDRGIQSLLAAKKSLKSSLEKSKAIGLALGKTGPRFDEIEQRLPSLEAAVRPIRADRDALGDVGGNINRAVGPAAAVLKVFDAVHGLEKSLLSDPRSDLSGYLAVLKRLEEALKFLGENCGLAIQWLEDIVEYLGDHKVADEKYLLNLKKSLRGLREFHNDVEGVVGGGGEKERSQLRLDGGLRDAALDKLESEFRRLLKDNSVPLPMASPSSLGDQACIAPSQLPVTVIHKLQAILGRLRANNRLDKCISIYVEVRSSNVRASLQALDLDYLDISVSEFNDVQSIEGYIAQWGNHLEFAVKHLFEAEFKLCNDVFERLGLNVWMDCFSKIAAQAGMLAFLQFGKTVTDSKKDPIKLLKLLDIFTSLNKLRADFNRLFGGAACIEIQNFTRDLIKRIIDGAAEIFWELLVQVEIQKQTPPPNDGGVPRLVSFVTDYCNKLIGEKYKSTLTQVLLIHKSWRSERFQDNQLMVEVLRIIKAIEQNLDVWMKAYPDQTLAHFFGMNNHWHLYKNLKGTKIGDHLGDSWLKEHEQYKEYYATVFLRDSWGKLPSHLSREGLILFSGGHATARDLVKKRLKAFNDAFDEMHKKQVTWVLPEKDLRDRVCQQIVQAIVPVYRSYMQNYGPLVEKDASSSKYVRYTVVALEKILSSLYMPKPMRYGSFKGTPPSEKHKNDVDLRRTTSAVV
ncbi:PREDICTED: exocyst complex component EXO70A1-like isoform X2 [Camelina sativa]|uniref:Exocyst subunit Exo70 family protein n=1 Tax=Camelina sativa TaxID=90675 RepID=A0ABM0U9S3_CAMSA|nr:PREDICTED: exocyst complex component EXO70A1-like isoform X1 [Camelina sativa]XP_010438026.1 PREDICTED: exocyst complex component EXO70A1-like isoform X3 [Camelina sativa]XP_019088640.1 PREDICTED: exocyst complex component EXO70A1-like isoform X2 [Camelina sativa]